MSYYLCSDPRSSCPASGLPDAQRAVMWSEQVIDSAETTCGDGRTAAVEAVIASDLVARNIAHLPEEVGRLAASLIKIVDGGCAFDTLDSINDPGDI